MAYRTSGEPRDIEIDPEEILAAQKRRTKQRLTVLGIAAGALALAGGAVAYTVAARARAETQQAWDRLSTCLVGDAGDVEKPSVRMRNAQLEAMNTSPSKRRTVPEEAWPERCAPLAHRMGEIVRSQGGSASLGDAAESLGKALSLADSVAANLTAPVDALFAEAKAAHLQAHGVRDVRPPAAAAPMTLTSLPDSARMLERDLLLTSVFPEPVPDATFRFIVDAKDRPKGPASCAFDDAAKELACREVPAPAAKFSPALRPWGTTCAGAMPLVFAGERGRTAIVRSDTGAHVIDASSDGVEGAAALDGGRFAFLQWHETPPETHFVHIAADGTRKETRLVGRAESGNPYYTMGIFWNYVVYKYGKKPEDGIRLVIRDIQSDGELGPMVDAGRIPQVGRIEGGSKEKAHLSACRSSDTTVLRAKGWTNAYLSFLQEGRWMAPVESKDGNDGVLQCGTNSATITRTVFNEQGSRVDTHIQQEECNVSGCTPRGSIGLSQVLDGVDLLMPRDVDHVRAVDVDDKLLLVWQGGDRGGLRMRLAPITRFHTAPETVLYDDHIRDGAFHEESTITAIELFPVPHGALLFLGTVEGIFIWHIDATGKRTPIPTRQK